MKGAFDAILQPAQAQYLDSLLAPRDPLLERMERHAARHGHPIADPEVAQLLRILVRLARPRRILEIGTNIGYSVVAMGRECSQETILETIEIDEAIAADAKQFVEEANLPCVVRFHLGSALDVLSIIGGPFDFVFIDCVKTEYEAYLDALLDGKMEPGALIVCDNVLWKGQVATEPANEGQSASTLALRRFNARLSSDPRLQSTIVPVGDGIALSIVV